MDCIQYVIDHKRKPINCGSVKMVFITRKNLENIPTLSFGTAYGSAFVSTPEATIMDIVAYHHHCGGLDNVLTLLTEWKEKIDGDKLFQLAINSKDMGSFGYAFANLECSLYTTSHLYNFLIHIQNTY